MNTVPKPAALATPSECDERTVSTMQRAFAFGGGVCAYIAACVPDGTVRCTVRVDGAAPVVVVEWQWTHRPTHHPELHKTIMHTTAFNIREVGQAWEPGDEAAMLWKRWREEYYVHTESLDASVGARLDVQA